MWWNFIRSYIEVFMDETVWIKEFSCLPASSSGFHIVFHVWLNPQPRPMSEYPVTRAHVADYERDGDSQKTCGKCSFLHCSSLTRSMDVFSMIKHSIISDEANPITKYFDIRQHVGSCGPDMIWKIHNAYRIEDNKVKSLYFFLSIKHVNVM